MEVTQKLILADDVFDLLEDGKTCTIRKGRKDIQLGFLKFESIDKREEIVFVKIVLYCKLKNIPIDYVINDGFIDHDDIEKQMKRLYPDIDENTEVTIVEFITQPDSFNNNWFFSNTITVSSKSFVNTLSADTAGTAGTVGT